MEILDRPNISRRVAEILREMIYKGDLGAGDTINEVQLAAQMRISRTPLREALSMLVAEKAIDQIPRRGFFVCELTEQDARDIYAMRPILEPEALVMAGIPSSESLDKLAEINSRLSQAKDAKSAIQVDDLWHRELVKGCPNVTLRDLIEHFMRRTHRYELAVMGQENILSASVQSHKDILVALRAHKMDEACDHLRKNLNGIEPVLNWLILRS